jgi:subfamily B ATP-binding cassette protein MsbA
MKTYFRLLSFAKPIEKYAIPYVIATIIATIFQYLQFYITLTLYSTPFLQKDQPSHRIRPNQAKLPHILESHGNVYDNICTSPQLKNMVTATRFR